MASRPNITERGQRPVHGRAARRRLASALAGCAVIGILASSLANRQRAALRCIDGQLVAFRGRALPAGETPLDRSRFPPLEAQEPGCRDQLFSSIEELERRYLAITLAGANGSLDTSAVSELADHALDPSSNPDALDEFVGQRRKAAMISLIESDLDEASTILTRVRTRLRNAEAAGVSPSVIRALQDQLDLLVRDVHPADVPSSALDGQPPPHPDERPHVAEPPTPRSL